MSNGAPQFATVEYKSQPGSAACKSCRKPTGTTHYRVNGVVTCPECAQSLRRRIPADSHAVFVRAISFGLGAAVLGFAIYAAFALATGWMIGYVSLAVGFLVGKAMMMGSGGVGGRRYQIAAMVLTYMAVSMAAVPIAVSQMNHSRAQQSQSEHQQPQARGTASASVPGPQKMGFAQAAGVLVLLGLASPFLELTNPAHGIIGLIILFVGIRIAWKLTAGKPLNIVGPIDAAAPATSG